MKAFLSHSSKDKQFVRQVGTLLGAGQCEYDEHSFEFTLNAQAIRQALARSDIFVLFLSASSVKSSFVLEEMSTALDYRAQGKIRRVLIFAIDDTSYSALPEWLKSINVVIRASGAKVCARAIEAEMFALAAEDQKGSLIYIPRTKEERELRKALSQAPGRAPVAIHVVGHLGLGRRTLLAKV